MQDKPAHIDMASMTARVDAAQAVVGDGPVVMLNMLRFREIADYSLSPELAPATPISGAQAYRLDLAAVEPRMKARGGGILFLGESGPFLLGPAEERWDMILLASWPALSMLAASPADQAYRAIEGHRTAALEDSRLLPMRRMA